MDFFFCVYDIVGVDRVFSIKLSMGRGNFVSFPRLNDSLDYNVMLYFRFGFNGHECVLRAICELAESPLLEDGVLGELLNILLK